MSPKRQAPSLAERAGLRFQTSNGVTSYDLDSDNLAALERMVEMLPAQQRQQVATYRQRQGHTLASLRQRVDISLDAHHDPSHTGHAHTLASWVGTKVQIVGLVTPAGMSINGLVSTVIGYQACPSEHMIVSIAELPHDACVKAANLQTPVSQRNERVATPPSYLAPNATTLRAQPPPNMQPPSPPPSPPEEEPSDPNTTQRELAEVKHRLAEALAQRDETIQRAAKWGIAIMPFVRGMMAEHPQWEVGDIQGFDAQGVPLLSNTAR